MVQPNGLFRVEVYLIVRPTNKNLFRTLEIEQLIVQSLNGSELQHGDLF